MSYISDAFDYLKTQISTSLPNHRQIKNPYFVEDEDALTLEQAWGLSYSDGSLETVNSYIIDITQTFELVLVRTVRGFKESISIRETAEKNIFEDRLLASKAIYSNWLNAQLNPFIKDLVITNDGGVEFIRSDRQDIITLRTVIDVRFHEKST